MNTHRVYMDASTVVTCWVREDAGRTDLSAATLRAYLYPYGSSMEVETAGIAATGTSLGKITFTATLAYGDTNLKPGSYRLSVRDSSDVPVYAGLLEAV